MDRGFKSKQPCWTCKKAVGGSDCPWANELKAVEGWKAEKTVIKQNGRDSGDIETYNILECPLYEAE